MVKLGFQPSIMSMLLSLDLKSISLERIVPPFVLLLRKQFVGKELITSFMVKLSKYYNRSR